MRRDITRWRMLANAGFALAVLALGGFGLYHVASRRWHVQPTFHVRTGLPPSPEWQPDIGFGFREWTRESSSR